MMKSLGAAVRISKGRPPASRIASLTTLATPSRWLKQIASSDELLTTAIFGFSKSSSLSPSAFHCARRTASRGDPGSKLLRRGFFIFPGAPRGNLSQSMATPASQIPPGQSDAPELLTKPAYWNYVLGLLTICYVMNTVDRSTVLAASLQAIKREFNASDFQMGMLTGVPFALFYSTMGIPIAAWADRSSRRTVLGLAVAVWSGMTALCGMAANYAMLFASRVGTAIGEAGGSPPSHSLISDYFPKSGRGTAFAIYALAVPVGTSVGAALGGWGNQHLGWRLTFIMVGLPGILLALLVRLTVIEPPRGYADGSARAARAPAPPLSEVIGLLWSRRSFRHM